jgi:3-deoxy-D-manno-octulosonic-acid transferase
MDKAQLHRFAGRSVGRYIELVYRTSRLISEPADIVSYLQQYAPYILSTWHGQFLLVPRIIPPTMPVRYMVAKHGDAEIYAQALSYFDLELIRGAGAGQRQKDRGGAQALRGALKCLGEGVSVGMTADVPPGPARRAGEGVVTLARLSGRPIIPFAAATNRYHALNTWSRMTVNLPFGRLAGVCGAPIWVDRKADAAAIEAARRAVEDGMNRVTGRAYELAGANPRRATPLPPTTANSYPEAPGLGLRTYSAATRLAQPAASLLLGLRERRGREDGARRNERMGQACLPRPEGRLVWIHAASVGEINAVLPLADALREQRADLEFLFTSGTVTSAGLAARRLGPHDIHQYVPLDTPQFVQRFLEHWRPDLAVFTESEIWPNLVIETAARRIPLALVNARMSNRSYGRWKRFRGLSRPLFSRFDIVLAQNEKFARRFGEIGARNTLAVGNLKIDAPPPPVDESELIRLKRAIAQRPAFVAASTHDGEERAIAAAHRGLTRQLAGFCTVIAPRHPERGTEIAELVRGLGMVVAQRSLGVLPTAATDIYVADTIGELGTLYALAPIAFIGGSLVDKGGQNPIEAIRHGAVILTGPHHQNFRDAYQALLRHHGALEVSSADELAGAILKLIGDEVELARMRAGAQTALLTLSGALQRTVAELIKFLPEDKGLRRAS